MLGISGNHPEFSQPLRDEEAKAFRRANRRRSTRRSIRKVVKSMVISAEKPAAATSQLLVGDDFSVGEEDTSAASNVVVNEDDQEDKSQIKRQMSFSDLRPRVAVHVSLSDGTDSGAPPTAAATPERKLLRKPSMDLMKILDDDIPAEELPRKTTLRRPSMSGLEQMRQLGGEMGSKGEDDEYSLRDLDSSSCGSSTFNLDDEQAMGLQLSFHACTHDLSQHHDQHVRVDRIPCTVVASPMGDAINSEELGFGEINLSRVKALTCPPTEEKTEEEPVKILEAKEIAVGAIGPFVPSTEARVSDGVPRSTNEEFETTTPVLKRRSSTSERARKPLNRKRSSLGKEDKKKPSTERRRSSRIAQGPQSSEVALGASLHSMTRMETSSRSTRSISAQQQKRRPPKMNSRTKGAGNDCPSGQGPLSSRRERMASKRPTSSSRRQPRRSVSSDSPEIFVDNPTVGEDRSSSKGKRVPSRAPNSRDKPRRCNSSDGGPDAPFKRNIVRRSVSAMDVNIAFSKDGSTHIERSSRRPRRPSSRRTPSTAPPVSRALPRAIAASAKEEKETENANLASRLTRTLSKSRRESDPAKFTNTRIVTPRQRRQSYTYTPLSKKKNANSVAMVKHFQLALAIGIDGSEHSAFREAAFPSKHDDDDRPQLLGRNGSLTRTASTAKKRGD